MLFLDLCCDASSGNFAEVLRNPRLHKSSSNLGVSKTPQVFEVLKLKMAPIFIVDESIFVSNRDMTFSRKASWPPYCLVDWATQLQHLLLGRF